jgi:hypothetical protein
METEKASFYKIAVHFMPIVFVLGLFFQTQSQEIKFYAKGNPEKWNVEITPFLVLPWVSGEVQSEQLSEDFGIDPAGFIESLNGTLMMDVAVSKGKFFAFAGYIYNYNGIEKILWMSDNSNQTITAKPELQRHILQVSGGYRFWLGDKFILDPYAGFRYTYYHLFGEVEGISNTNELDEYEDFWDPVLGWHAYYFPHPRIPIELRVDFGGFGAGSEFTWSAWFNCGYSVSPAVDLILGFASLSNEYQDETSSGNKYGMSSITYGIDFGARFYIPGRGIDPSIFKKFTKE